MGRGRNMQQIVLGHGICGQSVAKVVKYAAQKAGLDFDGISGHSLRAGAVTAAANTGSSDAEIMKMTGHANLSTMRRYVRDVHAFGGRNPLAGVL
jgi:integrase